MKKSESNKIIFQHSEIKLFISVIIPVYKDVKGLEDTLNSLQHQTIDARQYEIIVANDGSDIDISKLCNTLNVNEVKIYPNLGSYNARNKALEKSRGEYLAFTDADVIVPKNWLENGIKALSGNDYVGGNINIDKTKINSFASMYDYYTAFPVELYLKYYHYAPTANLFVRRKIFEVLGCFDGSLRSGGDNEFGDRVYRSKKFNQAYSTIIPVIHPPRGYNEIIKKLKRITNGNEMLFNKYPERFPNLRITYKNLLIRTLIPPRIFTRTKNFFLYILLCLYNWWLQINIVIYLLSKR